MAQMRRVIRKHIIAKSMAKREAVARRVRRLVPVTRMFNDYNNGRLYS